MKIRDLIENLQACDPEAEVSLSLEFNRENLDPDQIVDDGNVLFAFVPVGSHANSIGERRRRGWPAPVVVSDNGDFVILEAQAGHIADAPAHPRGNR
jgi:hypothetical protein